MEINKDLWKESSPPLKISLLEGSQHSQCLWETTEAGPSFQGSHKTQDSVGQSLGWICFAWKSFKIVNCSIQVTSADQWKQERLPPSALGIGLLVLGVEKHFNFKIKIKNQTFDGRTRHPFASIKNLSLRPKLIPQFPQENLEVTMDFKDESFQCKKVAQAVMPWNNFKEYYPHVFKFYYSIAFH